MGKEGIEDESQRILMISSEDAIFLKAGAHEVQHLPLFCWTSTSSSELSSASLPAAGRPRPRPLPPRPLDLPICARQTRRVYEGSRTDCRNLKEWAALAEDLKPYRLPGGGHSMCLGEKAGTGSRTATSSKHKWLCSRTHT